MIPILATVRRVVRRWVELAALCILASSFQSIAHAEDREVVFGLIPALSPDVMVGRYQPLAMHLTKKIHVPVRLAGAPDYETYMNRVLEGASYDMIITGGDFYRLAEQRAGYKAIARVAGPGVQALIVGAKDDNYASFADLPQNVRVASVGELALMHRLGSKTLRENGLNFGENAMLVPTPSHNAAMLSVLSGHADIAIIAAPFFSRVEESVRDRIVILERTDLVPHHAVSVRGDMSEDVAIRLTEALLALPDTPEGQATLETVGFPGFVVPEPGIYQVMDWAADDLGALLGLEKN